MELMIGIVVFITIFMLICILLKNKVWLMWNKIFNLIPKFAKIILFVVIFGLLMFLIVLEIKQLLGV